MEATAEDIEAGRLLFARETAFFWATADIDGLPPMDRLEIAFAGRSNVGKSSLINALTGRKALARTSRTPGRTQQLNFFNADDRLTLVDMPGYGFAAAGKEKVATWTRLIKDYLRGRTNLARVFVLIDARHGFKELDRDVLDGLDKAAVSYQVVLTKLDAIKESEIGPLLAGIQEGLARRPAAYPQVIATSSEKGIGIAELRGSIARLLAERA
jgi:GTP-binding protein